MKTLIKILSSLILVISMSHSIDAKVLFTEQAGGTSGTKFMLPSNRASILATEDIVGVAIQHGRRIEQIVLIYADAKKGHQMESIGNDDGEWSIIQLEKGEFITYVTGRAGTLIDQISFHTSLRRTFGPYGGPGGVPFELNIPSNAKVIGFTGTAGPSIHSIGLIYRTYERSTEGNAYTPDFNISDLIVTRQVVETGNQISTNVRDHRTTSLKEFSSHQYMQDFTIRDSVANQNLYEKLSFQLYTPIPDFNKTQESEATMTQIVCPGNYTPINKKAIDRNCFTRKRKSK